MFTFKEVDLVLYNYSFVLFIYSYVFQSPYHGHRRRPDLLLLFLVTI